MTKIVRHLEAGYAQSHPDEDFAETFAVWLTPRSRWRKTYEGWPALEKLTFVDDLMRSLAGKTPPVASRREILPLAELRATLGQHYRRLRAHYGLGPDRELDGALSAAFGRFSGNALCRGQEKMTAASFLRKIKKEVRQSVARKTGEFQYTVDRVLQGLIRRSERLGLEITEHDAEQEHRLTSLITQTTARLIENGRHRVAI